jgi:two-component system NarL family sensor kinase
MSADLSRSSSDADAPTRPGSPPRWATLRWPWAPGLGRELWAFLAVALLALVAVAAGTVIASERIARATALAEARRPGARQNLDRVVQNRIGDNSATSVVIWAADGTVLYASHDDLAGAVFTPSEELLAAVAGEVVAEVDEEPETAYEGVVLGPMVEVYTPITVDGQALAFEAYFSYDRIEREAALLRGQIIPMAVGALVLLQLVQIPIATSLARRVRRHEADRSELMALTLTGSDRERRAIAADLHDGPVQDLAGVSYALGGLRLSMPVEQQATVDRLVGVVRHAVDSLRRLMVDIYPPDLSGPGLGAALDDLVQPLRAQGITVSLDVGPVPEMSPDAAAAVYRTAKETLANVATHARATAVWVRLEATRHEAAPAVLLEVADDGVGFPDSGVDRRSEGHLGMRLVLDRVVHLGGRVELGRRPGGGAVVTAVLPVDHIA